MRIETTAMDDVWLGMVMVALAYLVMRTLGSLKKLSNKVDAMVNHIGEGVESAGNRLSGEARCIVSSLEKSALCYRDNLLEQVQNVELRCYRSRNGIAFGFGQRRVKKKSHSKIDQSLTGEQHQQQHHSTALYRCVDRIIKLKYKWPMSSSSSSKKHSAKRLECKLN